MFNDMQGICDAAMNSADNADKPGFQQATPVARSEEGTGTA